MMVKPANVIDLDYTSAISFVDHAMLSAIHLE